ncbi:MAG: PHP domain-containing protein [Bacillota bacterium]
MHKFKRYKSDMHMHSIYSDGFLTPEQLVLEGVKQGVQVMSLTDHDTMQGVSEMLSACKKADIIGISGVEFSSMAESEVHIIGYGLDENDSDLQNEIKYLQDSRAKRNDVILQKLEENGIIVTIEEMREFSNHVLGRSQIGIVMAKKGYVKNVNEAFDLWIGNGKPCFVSSHKKTPEEIIDLILKYNGKAVLAHPGRLKIKNQEAFIRTLKNRGLYGIEVHYSTHSYENIRFYNSMAKKYNLIATVGSDFHGEGRSAKIGKPDWGMDEEIIRNLIK